MRIGCNHGIRALVTLTPRSARIRTRPQRCRFAVPCRCLALVNSADDCGASPECRYVHSITAVFGTWIERATGMDGHLIDERMDMTRVLYERVNQSCTYDTIGIHY